MFSFRKIEANVHLHCVVRVCGTDCQHECGNYNSMRRRKRRSPGLEEDSEFITESEINLITSPSIKVRMPGQMGQTEGQISRDKEELERIKLPQGVSDAILIVLIVVLVMVICAIAIGVYMMMQKRRTALAEQILEDSKIAKPNSQPAAGTGFSNFGFFG
jgi:hypothetical protein